MAALLGMVRFDGASVEPACFSRLEKALAGWAAGIHSTFVGDSFGLVCISPSPDSATPGRARLPRRMADGSWLAGVSRIDNRGGLARELSLSRDELAADGNILEAAYLKWGGEACRRLYGDWSFAVWNPAERQLLLARDHDGITSLYYHRTPDYMVFASSRKAILAMEGVSERLDESYLAEMLLSWPTCNGERTVYSDIQSVPPAHLLEAGPGQIRTHCYWSPSMTVTGTIRTLDEAVEGFTEVWDEAVACRLRGGPIASTLSGGLDSTAVTVTAARLLHRGEGDQNRMRVYTAVPFHPTIESDKRIVNEWELASRTAAWLEGVEHRPVSSPHSTPLDGLAYALWIHDSPIHAAANTYWTKDAFSAPVSDGAKVLLIGQKGNTTISWPGKRLRSPRAGLHHPWALLSSARRRIRGVLPAAARIHIDRTLMRFRKGWLKGLLNPHFARRIGFPGKLLQDPLHPYHVPFLDPSQWRWYNLRPGRSPEGAILAENAAVAGIEIRDPTADVRVIEYCLQIPDHLLVDPETGMSRMLIRRAMKHRVPDEVRLNRRRGLQASDLVSRLRLERARVDDCLKLLESGPAAAVLNLAGLCRKWDVIQTQATEGVHPQVTGPFLRAMMIGLFVQQPSFPRPKTLAENLGRS